MKRKEKKKQKEEKTKSIYNISLYFCISVFGFLPHLELAQNRINIPALSHPFDTFLAQYSHIKNISRRSNIKNMHTDTQGYAAQSLVQIAKNNHAAPSH